jgi:FAD-linked sulfhydryl oxidase
MPGHIPPTTWGPFFWHTIHLVALGYPNTPTYAEKRAAKEFYESLVHLIPCPTCKIHYADHLKNKPITPSLDSRKDLFQWTIDIHNEVNKDLGKPLYTDADAIAFYNKLGSLGRSPVYTPEDVHSLYFAQIAKYGTGALVVAAITGVALYYFSKKD